MAMQHPQRFENSPAHPWQIAIACRQFLDVAIGILPGATRIRFDGRDAQSILNGARHITADADMPVIQVLFGWLLHIMTGGPFQPHHIASQPLLDRREERRWTRAPPPD